MSMENVVASLQQENKTPAVRVRELAVHNGQPYKVQACSFLDCMAKCDHCHSLMVPSHEHVATVRGSIGCHAAPIVTCALSSRYCQQGDESELMSERYAQTKHVPRQNICPDKTLNPMLLRMIAS